MIGAGVTGAVASALMQTLLTNATPRIVAELHAPHWYGFVGGCHLATSTLTLPVFAQWADRIGPRRVFALGHLCFAAGALGVALAPDMGWLLAARALQGVGGGAIAPATVAAIGMVHDEDQRGHALTWFALSQVVANGIGAPLGGWMTDGPGWRVGMAVTVPIGLFSLVLARHLPTRDVPPRWWGFSARAQWRMWQDARLGTSAALALLLGVAMLGCLTYAPLLLQDRHALSPTVTGWLLLPMLLGLGAGVAVSGRLEKHPAIRPMSWTLVLLGTIAALAPSPVVVAVGFGLDGIGLGAAYPLLLLDAQAAVDREHLARASGLIQFGRNAGAAVGVPLLSLWLAAGSAALPGLFLTLAVTALAGLHLTRKAIP